MTETNETPELEITKYHTRPSLLLAATWTGENTTELLAWLNEGRDEDDPIADVREFYGDEDNPEFEGEHIIAMTAVGPTASPVGSIFVKTLDGTLVPWAPGQEAEIEAQLDRVE